MGKQHNTMLEARIAEGALLKKLIEAMKDLVTEANFDCDASGISLQAMDSSHVSLIAMQLKADGFEHYRCDRNVSIGMNLASLSKILKCPTTTTSSRSRPRMMQRSSPSCSSPQTRRRSPTLSSS